MASAQLAVVRADEETRNRVDADAERDSLVECNEDLRVQVRLLLGLLEDSASAHQGAKERLAYAEESLGLSRETATLWEDLYHAIETRGRATGLVVAMAATLAGVAGYLLALAQVGAFLR